MNFDIGIQLSDGSVITIPCISDDSKSVIIAVTTALSERNIDMSQVELIDILERI
jgi:hypothetical protein